MRKIIVSERRFLFLLFATAVFIRIFFIFAYDNQKFLHNEYYANDEKIYVRMAQTISSGQKAEAESTGLGYPIFLAAIFALFGKNFIVVRIIQAFLGGATCIFIYYLAKEIFNKDIGMVSSLILAFDPFHVYRTVSLLSELIFVFLLTAALFFIYRGVFSRKIHIFILGNIFLGVTSFSRATTYGLYPFIFLWLVLIFWNAKREMLIHISLLLIVSFFLILAGRFTVSKFYLPQAQDPSLQKVNLFDRLWSNAGDHFVGNSSDQHLGITYSEYHAWRNNLYASLKGLPDFERKKRVSEAFYIYAKEHPGLILKIIYERFITFWRVYPQESQPGKPQTEFGGLKFKIVSLLSYGLLLPFFILGSLVLLKRWKETFLLYALIILFVLVHTIMHSAQIRYRMQIEPAIIIFGSFGLIWFIKFANKRINLLCR